LFERGLSREDEMNIEAVFREGEDPVSSDCKKKFQIFQSA
jgi:hypothetical protein